MSMGKPGDWIDEGSEMWYNIYISIRVSLE